MMPDNKHGIRLCDFSALRDTYYNFRLKMKHQPSGVTANKRDLHVFVNYCRQAKIDTITGSSVIDFFSYLSDERENSSGAINRKRSSLLTYIRYLAANQVPGAGQFPVSFIPKARHAYRGPVKVLEPEETQKLLDSIDRSSVLGYRDFTLYSLLYCLGLRLGEALAIDIADIDFNKAIVRIHGKGRKERELPLNKHLISLIKQYLKYRKEIFNSCSCNALFLSKKGLRLSLRAAEDTFQNMVNTAGPFSIPHVVPHTLRHCFASHALENKSADLVVIKAILGHALMRSTEIYLHPSMRRQRASLDTHVAVDMVVKIRSNRKWMRGIQRRAA
jgi:site-specific recombinase XerD